MSDSANVVRQLVLASADLHRRCADELAEDIARAGLLMAEGFSRGQKLLVFGNGGSAADAQHFAAELSGRFELERPALPALALTTDSSALTSIGNDFGFAHIYARQIEALARTGDLVVGISTSGNSANVLHGMQTAKRIGCVTIGLAGNTGGQLPGCCDFCITVPGTNTARVQECHITILHAWCALIEKQLAAKERKEHKDGKF